MWRKFYDMKIIAQTCSHDCYGVNDYHGSCCRIENRDFIIGPITDTEQFLQRLKNQFNREIDYDDIFINFEEGSKLFPEKSSWQRPGAYPALRPDLTSKDLHCIFYNNTVRACSIYNIRPSTCYKFVCEHLQKKLKNETVD